MGRGSARVLIVDDHPDIITLLRTSLELAGFETLDALDGRAALQRIDREAPDLVLLDLMMPVLDGWGVLEALKDREDRPPVIVLSAIESADSMERAERLGVAGYVTKPFDLPGLIGLVESALGTLTKGTRTREGQARRPSPSA